MLAHRYLLLSALALTAPALALAEDPSPAADAPKADAPADTPKEDAAKEEAKPEAAKPAEPEKPADKGAAAATQVVSDYLGAVKAKKWDAAKKFLHPKTLAAIAEIKKRRGVEDHELAPWAKLGEQYMTAFETAEPVANAKGAYVVPSTESVFSVEDKGTEDGVKAEYLVLSLHGKSYVAARRLGENEFDAKLLPTVYKGWFDDDYVEPPPVAPEKKHKK